MPRTVIYVAIALIGGLGVGFGLGALVFSGGDFEGAAVTDAQQTREANQSGVESREVEVGPQQVSSEPKQPQSVVAEPEGAQARTQSEPPAADVQVAVADDSTEAEFLGFSDGGVDRFTGSLAVTVAATGNGGFPYEGLLALRCEDRSITVRLADIPFVSNRQRFGYMEFITPSMESGEPLSVRGPFYDTADGGRALKLNAHNLTRFLANGDSIEEDSNSMYTLYSGIINEGEVLVRLATFDETFTANFVFGDVSRADHWDDFLECVDSNR